MSLKTWTKNSFRVNLSCKANWETINLLLKLPSAIDAMCVATRWYCLFLGRFLLLIIEDNVFLILSHIQKHSIHIYDLYHFIKLITKYQLLWRLWLLAFKNKLSWKHEGILFFNSIIHIVDPYNLEDLELQTVSVVSIAQHFRPVLTHLLAFD